MRKAILTAAVVVLIEASSFAGTIQLGGGETITINANTQTTVSCGATPDGGGNDFQNCTELVADFKKILDDCLQFRNVLYCINTFWPTFKAESPKACISAGRKLCIEKCEPTNNTLKCMTEVCK